MEQDAQARKKRSAEEGPQLSLTPEFLQQTELKRWPDYHFLIGQDEPGALPAARTSTAGPGTGRNCTAILPVSLKVDLWQLPC